MNILNINVVIDYISAGGYIDHAFQANLFIINNQPISYSNRENLY